MSLKWQERLDKKLWRKGECEEKKERGEGEEELYPSRSGISSFVGYGA